ncbi:F-box protein At3g07870-like [Durio zibethinus]|uniref:F-box protein At3g07870-like n=1 Tax=Durio zibethinus TaxID=66656 RepID=A0A6P6A5J7_DURZI|nr:F-box protein At3g07870-like [Durio zibethinus]
MERLAQEIVLHMLSRLPVTSLLQSKLVCRAWRRFPMELPKLIKYPPRLGLYGFGFLPTTKEYKLVHIYYHRNFRPGGDPQIPASTLEQSEVLVGGRLHWLSDPNRYTRAGQIISFYLTTEKFQEFLPKPDYCGLVRCFHQLVVLRGCLSAAAYHDNDKLEIWVVKEYAVKESWIKEFTIGTYLPTTLRQHDLKLVLNSKDYFPETFAGVLWILKNGEILLEYMGRELVLYDPRQGTFKELICPEMLKYLKIIAHVVSLIGTDNTVIIS